MPRAEPITAADVDAELRRMQAEIDQLKARPELPRERVIREFEETFQRNVENGRKLEAENKAREERELDKICASRSWVRITCGDTTVVEIPWRETVMEPGMAEFRSFNGVIEPGAPRGEWFAPLRPVERTISLAGRGHALEVATEFTRRIVNSPELARLVETGALVVTPLTAEENRTRERYLLRTERALPVGLAGASPTAILRG